MQDDKYIVFKKDEWDKMYGTPAPHQVQPINDAVVIRRQDKFAAPALHTYASVLSAAAEVCPITDLRINLQRVADYFHEQAMLATEARFKKFPD